MVGLERVRRPAHQGRAGPHRRYSGRGRCPERDLRRRLVLRERLIDIDDAGRRIVYSILADVFEHHSASNTVVPEGEGRCRLVWVVDFLPEEPRDKIEAMMNAGGDAIKAHMEAAG
jgi:hypothetical protein